MNPHEPRSAQPHSHLFTVRLWQEALGNDAYEVRMQVRHVLSGEIRYFREWLALVAYLRKIVHAANQSGGPCGRQCE